MTQINRSRAVVLKKGKLGEADLRATVLTENGEMLSLRVHGIRKSKRRGQLVWTPGNTLDVVYYQKANGLLSVKEAVLAKDRIPAKASWDYLKNLHSLLSLFSDFGRVALGEMQLFLLADGSLDVLWEIETKYKENKAKSSKGLSLRQLLFVFLKIRLFRLSGLLGDPETCSICTKILNKEAFFQFPELSFLCKGCAERQGAEATARDLLKARVFGLLARTRFGEFQRIGMPGLENFLSKTTLDEKSKDNMLETLPFLEQIQRPPLRDLLGEIETELQRILEEV